MTLHVENYTFIAYNIKLIIKFTSIKKTIPTTGSIKPYCAMYTNVDMKENRIAAL